MADNAFVKIGTALVKHQVKKLVGEEALGAIGEELTAIGGDKLDAWLKEQTTTEELEKAAQYAYECFRDKSGDYELEQWMVSLPFGNLPKVVEALQNLPTSPDESKLENALRESVKQNWQNLTQEQVDNAVDSFLSCLRSALLPIEKQTLMIIGREVLRTGEKVDLLVRWFEQYIITGKIVEIKQVNPEPVETWNLKHPYPMPPNFTGRAAEQKILDNWLADDKDRLFILRALGGFGKSALAWQWINSHVNPTEWTKLVWWSFYEGDASFEHFIEEMLKYLKLEIPQGQRLQVDALLKALQSQKILLIMDGFERALRAYSSMNAAYQGDEEPKLEDNQFDCVNINAEILLKSICSLPNMKSKALMTTRLTPRTVKPRGEFMLGCREEELTAMQPADAVEFFHKQGIKGNRTEIEAACASYGCHPLSLRLLTGRILKDFESPADIIVAQKLKIDGDLKSRKHHILEVSYNNLPENNQKLLCIISCFRSSVGAKTLKAIVDDKKSLNDNLHDLIEYGLLNFESKNKRFDLHPIVRRYVYDLFSGKDTIHKKLIRHFQKQLDSQIPEQHRNLPKFLRNIVITEVQKQVETIEGLTPAIELYYHTVKVGNLENAVRIYHDFLMRPLFFRFGSYQTEISLIKLLFKDGQHNLLSMKLDKAKAWAFSELASAYAMNGQPRYAIPLFESACNMYYKELEDVGSLISVIGNLAAQQLVVGTLEKAELGMQARIELCSETRNEHEKAMANQELALALLYRGAWQEAKHNLVISKKYLKNTNDPQSLCIGELYESLYFLLMARSNKYDTKNVTAAIKSASRAIKLVENGDPNMGGAVLPRDLTDANWLLGACALVMGELSNAETYILKALHICRSTNSVDVEANVLLEYAKLLRLRGKIVEAYHTAEEAQSITERCGYVLQGADVNLFLAQYALEQEKDKVKAKEYAETALKLATCDGPPYYYKVAYEEAERMLESLK
jgi:tetratricopeptide (TPR) repeat protein